MTAASHLEIFVEEPSSAAALRVLVPRIRDDVGFKIYEFQGCHDLLGKLPERFRGFARWLPEDYRIVVLIDRDREDCLARKRKILEMARRSGLRTTARGSTSPQVLVRIAVEELESWFLGDTAALRRTFSGVPKDLEKKAAFRDPDAIVNTWEHLHKVLKDAGHFAGGFQKIRCAREIAAHMDPEVNRSHSFRVFRDGLRSL